MSRCGRMSNPLQSLQVSAQQPDSMFRLSKRVKEQFTERIARLSDADLHNHQKVVAFKDSISNSMSAGNARAEKHVGIYDLTQHIQDMLQTTNRFCFEEDFSTKEKELSDVAFFFPNNWLD